MKFKRLISCFLSMALLVVSLGAVSVSAKEQQDIYTDKEIIEYNDNIGLLRAIGILDKNTEYNISDTLTRGEMVKAIMQLLKIPPSEGYIDSPYADVTEETPEYGYIMAATQLGIVNGNGGLFRPDESILYEEASKIIISMLGYDYLAEENGGYPSGYLFQAMKLNIVSPSVGYNSYPINRFGFAKMIAEALKTDMMMGSIADYNGKKYTIESGTNLLNSVFKTDTVEGIVTRNIYTALNEPKYVYDKAVYIDGVFYQTNCDTSNLIGCKVKAYVNSDDEIIYIESRDRYNNIRVIDEENVQFSNFSYQYEVNDRIKSIKVNSKFNFIYNNKAKINIENSDMVPDNGYIELIDADKDEVYETVKVYDYRYMMVNRADSSKESVYAKYNGETLKLENADILRIKDGNGKDKDYTELAQNSILKILASEDGEVIFVEVSENKVKGEINKFWYEDDKPFVEVNHISYEMINNFIGDTPEVGKSGVLYISNDNKAVAFIAGNPNGTKMGILIDAAESKGLEEYLMLKIFTEDGEMLRIKGAEKVIVDGESRKTINAVKNDLLKGSLGIAVQPIFYTVNAEGRVSTIDTAYNIKATDPEDNPLSVPVTGDESETSLRRIYKGSETYLGSLSTFDGKLNLSESTKVFSIPADYANANDDDFSVSGSGSLENTASYTFDAYSASEADMIADIIITSADVNASAQIYAVVREVIDVYDENSGEVRTKLSMTSWNKNYELYTDTPEKVKKASSINAEDKNTYEISVGDFVAFSRMGNDKLETVKLVVDADEASENRYKGANNPTVTTINDRDRMIYGKVGVNYSSVISVNTGSVTEYWNAKKFRIYKYEAGRKKGTLESITPEEIYDEKNFGADANYALIYSDWAEPRIIIVY